MPRSSAKARAPAERGRLEAAAPRMTTAARRASQPTRGATGDATSFEIGAAGELIGCAGEATGATVATTGAGRSMDGPSCARTGVAVRTMAADSMKAAPRATRRPSMVHKVASQPPAVKVCSHQCREHIIWPLLRTHEMTARSPGGVRGCRYQGGGDARHARGKGASHASPGGHCPRPERRADMAAGGRYPRPESAQHSPHAVALRAVRL